MEKNRSSSRGLRAMAIVALIIAVVGLTVAYAAMSTTLKVNGTVSMSSATWAIQFENVSASKTGNATYNLPTVSSTTLSNYSVHLTQPGDGVTFIFDVANTGTIDAYLATLIKNTPVCNGIGDTAISDSTIVCGNMTYLLQYEDGTKVATNDLLKAGTKKKLKLVIAYDSSASQVPIGEVAISGLDITMVYNQK